MPGITFVTAYFPYVDTPHFVKGTDKGTDKADRREADQNGTVKGTDKADQKGTDLGDIDPIHDLLKTGVQICLYIPSDCSYRDVFDQWTMDYTHFKIMPLRIPKTYQQTPLFSLLNPSCCLPSCRNSEKDTIEHLLWLHYRMELLRDATRANPFGSEEFVWVDVNITSLFHRKAETLGRIGKIQKQLASVYLNSGAYSENSVFLPGCSAKPPRTAKPLESAKALAKPSGTLSTKIEPTMDQINWRFCGAFLAGKREAISAFCDEYLSELEHSVRKMGRITWDVNWLAYLESLKEYEQDTSIESDWTPVWYRADHNDSIIEILHGLPIPTYSLKELLQESNTMEVRQTEYELPIVDGYHPGSTSFVRWNDKAILNTRYINYCLANEGKNYVFATSEFIIRNKNYASTIDPVTADLVGVQEMNDPLLKRPRGDHTRYISYGLEDIRLFVGEHNTLQFIATTVDYSPVQWNRMMVGNYDMFTSQMTDCTVVLSPDSHGGCEKNWVPVFRPGIDTQTQFIYRWWPYEIGEIDASNQLRIHTSIPLEDPIFKNTRGSSIFQPCRKLFYETHSTKQEHGDFLVGVVHFSQTNASNAREYYHYLVALDRTTLLPVARTSAFYFFRKSIEFAIGFDVLETENEPRTETKCRFWVSRMDIDPIMIEVDWRMFRFEELRSYEY